MSARKYQQSQSPSPPAGPADTGCLQTAIAAEWSQEYADVLQQGIDEIFEGQASESDLGQLQFSFTIADPNIDGCPLIGCSTGFGELCGYDFHDIVGRNCRFLVDPVPMEFVNPTARRIAREFCLAVMEGREYRIEDAEREAWMPEARPSDDGVFLIQTNARRDGTLFKNMFYLKQMGLDDKEYIVGLQSEVDEECSESVAAAHKACKILDHNMFKLEKLLASKFWLYTSMRRQDEPPIDDGFAGS